MVVADVAGEPLEDFWEFIERAAFEGGGGVVPFFFALPIDSFVLVLHVEEPDASHGGDADRGALDEEVMLPAENGDEQSGEGDNGEIHPEDGIAIAPVGSLGRKAFANDEEKDRGDEKENEGIANEAIGEAFGAGVREVFVDGHGPDISRAASIEISRSTVMDRMLPAPVEVGCEGEEPGNESGKVVGAGRFKKGAVTAVVEDDEDPDEDSAADHGQGESEEIGELHREIHRDPEREIETDGINDLPGGFGERGLGMRSDDLFPFFDGRQRAGIAHYRVGARL